MSVDYGTTTEWVWLWWHWVALGLVLLSIDMLVAGVFYLLWIGLGAMLTGASVWFIPTMMPWLQMLLFGFYATLLLAVWIVLLRPRYLGRQILIATESLPGESGIVVRYNEQQGSGTLRLQRPIGGKDVWPFNSPVPVRTGRRVIIEAVDYQGFLSVRAGDDGDSTKNPGSP